MEILIILLCIVNIVMGILNAIKTKQMGWCCSVGGWAIALFLALKYMTALKYITDILV